MSRRGKIKPLLKKVTGRQTDKQTIWLTYRMIDEQGRQVEGQTEHTKSYSKALYISMKMFLQDEESGIVNLVSIFIPTILNLHMHI